jgi:2'-5' RNA ligase
MRIPEVRGRLYALSVECQLPELHQLAEELRRRYNGRAVRAASDPVTPQVTRAVRAYVAAYPDMPFHAVATVFRLNPGRVSEIVNGKRE